MEKGGEQPKEKNEKAEVSETPPIPIPPEIYKQLPSEARLVIQSAFQFRAQGGNPLLEKLTEKNVDDVVAEIGKENERRFKYLTSHRSFQMGVFAVTVAVFVFLVIFLKDEPSTLAAILAALLGFAGGFGIGKRVS